MFCKTFHVSPQTYYETLAEDVDTLLLIENEIKQHQKDEMAKAAIQSRIGR